MTDQRSAFGFRIPRLRQFVPPPRSTTQTTKRPPIRPQVDPSPRPPLLPASTLPSESSPLPPPIRPQGTTPAPPPTPALLVTPSLSKEPAASPPTVPIHPLGTVPASPPEPLVEPSTLPQDKPALLVRPSPTQPNHPFGTVPASHQSHPLNHQRHHTPELQDEPNPAEATPSSPLHSSLPELKTAKPQESSKTKSQPSSSSQTAIQSQLSSLPEDKIPVPESPKNLKLNGPETLSSKKTTSINLPNHHSNEKSPIVITLAGENRGTFIHIGAGAAKRHRKIHIHRKYKINPDEITDTTTDGEESSKENDLKPNENKEKNAYINCNVQGINNSLVFNSSVTERNPGVHRGSSSKPLKKPKRNNAKVNITPSQSQTHTIRRRCLRGLFMESSSDSDPNGPQKPRRHGCRYKSNKDDIMDVV